jgi:hypothetical protein
MSVVDDLPENTYCARHPSRETSLRCGKCERYICPRCAVQTPVGYRCADCAQLRRLPQYDVRGALLVRSFAAGLAVSALAWLVISYVLFLAFFLSFLVGAAVGEVMSRLSKRRSNLLLEAAAVLAVVGGLVLVEVLRFGAGDYRTAGYQFTLVGQLFPAIIASVVAVLKLRQ